MYWRKTQLEKTPRSRYFTKLGAEQGSAAGVGTVGCSAAGEDGLALLTSWGARAPSPSPEACAGRCLWLALRCSGCCCRSKAPVAVAPAWGSFPSPTSGQERPERVPCQGTGPKPSHYIPFVQLTEASALRLGCLLCCFPGRAGRRERNTEKFKPCPPEPQLPVNPLKGALLCEGSALRFLKGDNGDTVLQQLPMYLRDLWKFVCRKAVLGGAGG